MVSFRLRVAGALVVPALALSTLSACSGGRPATEDVEAGLTASGSLFPVAEQQAECAAKLLVDSELSDEVLQAVADADPDMELAPEDAAMLASLQVEVLQGCTS